MMSRLRPSCRLLILQLIQRKCNAFKRLRSNAWQSPYDDANHLVRAVETDSSATVVADAHYGYDAFGDRISMTVAQGGTTTTTQSAFEAVSPPMLGSDLTHWRLYADQGSGGTATVRYLSGGGADQWLGEGPAGSGAPCPPGA